MEIRYNERDGRHSLGLDRQTRDALAAYCRLIWPTGTAKEAARHFDLTLDEARGLIAGRASQTTVDRVWKSSKGGWRVALAVLGAVIGQTIDQYIESERAAHEDQARRLGAVLLHLRPVAGDRPAGDPAGAPVAIQGPERRASDRRRMVSGED